MKMKTVFHVQRKVFFIMANAFASITILWTVKENAWKNEIRDHLFVKDFLNFSDEN